MGVQPFAALGQRLRVGVDTRNALRLGALTDQQMVVNAQLDLATDDHVVFKKAVQRVVDRAFGGVFHRDHAKVHRTSNHFTEHFIDGSHRQTNHRMAEVLHGRGLGERTLRAEIGDLERLFKGQAGRHDFAKQPRHFFVAQWAAIAVHDPPKHRRLAFRAIEHRHFAFCQRRHFHPGHFLSTASALTDEFQDFLVEAVDTDAKRLEFLLGHQPCSFSKSFM